MSSCRRARLGSPVRWSCRACQAEGLLGRDAGDVTLVRVTTTCPAWLTRLAWQAAPAGARLMSRSRPTPGRSPGNRGLPIVAWCALPSTCRGQPEVVAADADPEPVVVEHLTHAELASRTFAIRGSATERVEYYLGPAWVRAPPRHVERQLGPPRSSLTLPRLSRTPSVVFRTCLHRRQTGGVARSVTVQDARMVEWAPGGLTLSG